MKKHKLLLCLMLTVPLTGSLQAQGLFARAGFGYNLSMPNAFLDYEVQMGTNSATSTGIYGTMGRGLSFGGAFGSMFSEYVGADLAFSYLSGSAIEVHDTYPGGSSDYTYEGRMLSIAPSVVLTTGADGFAPYTRFGMALGIGGKILTTYLDNDQSDIATENWELSGGMAAGFFAALGGTYSMSDKMGLFFELHLLSLSYAPKKGIMTEATYNGKDEMPGLTTREKEKEYVETVTSTTTSPPDALPEQEMKQPWPFGSLGIHVGVRIGL